MMIRAVLHSIFIWSCFFATYDFYKVEGASTQREDRLFLKRENIRPIMDKILGYHIYVKKISPEILRRSLMYQISTVDSQKMYFLQEEVDPYTTAQKDLLQKFFTQYQEGKFDAYLELYQTIEQAILRAQKIRSDLKSELLSVNTFKEVISTEERFPNSIEILREKWRNSYAIFVQENFKDFDAIPSEQMGQIFEVFDRQASSFESQFIGEEDSRAYENNFTQFVLKSLAGSLDSHTTFFSAAEAAIVKSHLEKELYGIGVVLKESSNGIYVYRVIPGGPAAFNGNIKANDLIAYIDGQPVSGMSLSKVSEVLKGEEGTLVVIGISRRDGSQPEGEVRFEVKLQRGKIALDEERVSSTFETYNNGIIGKIRLDSFYEGKDGISSDRDIIKELRNLRKKGPLKGLILDLRRNSGGFLMQAVKVAGLFITNGVIAISRDSQGAVRYLRDLDGHSYYDGPLIILTSKASASAAEIVAQSLKDYGRAIIVGDETTYGKGSIQHQNLTEENTTAGYFKVTVGLYYTVSGRSTQIGGVSSDVVVPSPYYYEKIGERYLNYPLLADQFTESYKDPLTDVPNRNKIWFEQYYLPRLQQKQNQWTSKLDRIRINSERRLQANLIYNRFRSLEGKEVTSDIKNEIEEQQMIEATEIMKDLMSP